MISPENEVFNAVATQLRLDFPGIYVAGETTAAPARYPAVVVEERSNAVNPLTIATNLDGVNLETSVDLMYQVDVYSNKVSGRKAEAKAIATVVDQVFTGLGFVRVSSSPMSNLENATVYRLTARYEGECDGDLYIYQ